MTSTESWLIKSLFILFNNSNSRATALFREETSSKLYVTTVHPFYWNMLSILYIFEWKLINKSLCSFFLDHLSLWARHHIAILLFQSHAYIPTNLSVSYMHNRYFRQKEKN